LVIESWIGQTAPSDFETVDPDKKKTAGCVMLQKTQEDVAYCYQRAEESRRMGARETDPARRQEYADMEQRWIKLAISYQFAEQLNSANDDIHRRVERHAHRLA